MQTKSPSCTDKASPPKQRKLFQFWQCFWLTFLVISLSFAWHSYYVPPNSIAWAKSYAAAQTQATESSNPMLLFFSGKWCVPCRIMKRNVFADQQVMTSVNSGFVPVAIDVNRAEDAALLARYNVVGPPITIVTDHHGTVLRWRAGSLTKREFLEFLRDTSPVIQNKP
ncbi:MAG: DUF255 domain-containing protein [Planctomycetaceae bacterium]|nr:DUF255 domain-containing protein [Planctomycetaceae bacterium]